MARGATWPVTFRDHLENLIDQHISAAVDYVAETGIGSFDLSQATLDLMQELEMLGVDLDEAAPDPDEGTEQDDEPEPTEQEIGDDLARQGGVGFIGMTRDDAEHIRRG